MTQQQLTEILFTAKKQKGLRFADLETLLGRDEVWMAALFYGQASAAADEAQTLGRALDLGAEAIGALQEFPLKGWGPMVPTDPLIYASTKYCRCTGCR